MVGMASPEDTEVIELSYRMKYIIYWIISPFTVHILNLDQCLLSSSLQWF